ncbi:hypothetical protein Tco_0438200 [Tanacetum coccineum]
MWMVELLMIVNWYCGVWRHWTSKTRVQLHYRHGHLDVPHVIDEFSKSDIVVMNGLSFVMSEVFKEKGQNRLEVVLDLDEGLLQFLQQVFPEKSPSEMMKFETLQGENSVKRQKTSEYEAYVSGESSSGQVNKEERGPLTSCNQEQEDDYDFWTDSYASDDDEIPSKQTTPLVQSCQRDPEAPALSLINQGFLYLKKGSSGPKKIMLSLHKFPAIIFNDDDIKERTSRWVNKFVKKFNPYARYGVDH